MNNLNLLASGAFCGNTGRKKFKKAPLLGSLIPTDYVRS